MRELGRPRANHLPQEVSSGPKPVSADEVDTRELSSRPLFIGSSSDVARRQFPDLTPGEAFGGSQEGRFGKHGRHFWMHVSDVYDWERALCREPRFRPGVREMATGIRLIVGDEFADHIAVPHGFLENGKSFVLAEEERQALRHAKYMAMMFKGSGPPGQEDMVLVLLLMPDQVVSTFSAHQGTPKSKEHLHDQAVEAMNKTLQDNTLSRLQWYMGKNGDMMKVTPGANWENPYLTLEAFRVFIREARRQRCDYEDWPHSERYSALPASKQNGDTARDFWCADLRGALGHRPDQPFMVEDASSAQEPRHVRFDESSIAGSKASMSPIDEGDEEGSVDDRPDLDFNVEDEQNVWGLARYSPDEEREDTA